MPDSLGGIPPLPRPLAVPTLARSFFPIPKRRRRRSGQPPALSSAERLFLELFKNADLIAETENGTSALMPSTRRHRIAHLLVSVELPTFIDFCELGAAFEDDEDNGDDEPDADDEPSLTPTIGATVAGNESPNDEEAEVPLDPVKVEAARKRYRARRQAGDRSGGEICTGDAKLVGHTGISRRVTLMKDLRR